MSEGAAAEVAARLEAGRLLFAQECGFLRGAADAAQLPPHDLPEVAFAGRSNVGKSSLVNALTGRNTLARTSNTPGRTQQLNFFDLGGRLCLVDLPGYGFARAPKAVVDAWTELVIAFLRGRPQLRLVCVLVDGRHGVKPVDDAAMAELGRAAVPFLLVLTKCDLVKPGELAARRDTIEHELRRRQGALPLVAVTSARTAEGIAALRAELAAYARSSTTAEA